MATAAVQDQSRQAEFRSRHQTLLIPIRPDHTIAFINGVYKTSDPAEIAALRQVVDIEARGNRNVVEVTGLGEGPRLEGIITCRFTGFAEVTVYARGQQWSELAAQIADQLVRQGLQQPETAPAPEADETREPEEPTQALQAGEKLKGKIRGRKTPNMEGVVQMGPLEVAAAVAGGR